MVVVGIIFYVVIIAVVSCTVYRALSDKTLQEQDPIKRISDLQKWEYIRSLSEDGTK